MRAFLVLRWHHVALALGVAAALFPSLSLPLIVAAVWFLGFGSGVWTMAETAARFMRVCQRRAERVEEINRRMAAAARRRR